MSNGDRAGSPEQSELQKNGKTFNASCCGISTTFAQPHRSSPRHVAKSTGSRAQTSVSDLKAMMETEGFHHSWSCGRQAAGHHQRSRHRQSQRPPGRRHHDRAAENDLPDTLLSHAITLALHWRISCVPVVENEKVIGILTAPTCS